MRSWDVDGRGGDTIRTTDGVSISIGGDRIGHGIGIGGDSSDHAYEAIGTR